MSDDDFGTVNLKRGDRTREIELLRQHRESLVKMLAQVDQELRELELTSLPATPTPSEPPQPAVPLPLHPARRGVEGAPLFPDEDEDDSQTLAQPGSGTRVLLIIGAAVLALAIIGYLIWKASSDRPAAGAAVEETGTVVPASADETQTIAAASTPPAMLAVKPGSVDYGLVRKGTRATRQYEVANNTDEPVTIALSRSTCRCLYYEHSPVVPPKGKESITVTVDGARAKAGNLQETVKITTKGDATVSTSFEVIATVR